jgi:oxysterol-binding protein 1
MTIDSNPSSFQDGYLEQDQIDIDLPDNNENQQGPPRNTHDLGFAGTRLIVKPDSRTELPYMLPVGHSVPIWKIIAKFVSQDLSKVSLPVVLCEPLNILQRSTEMMAHHDLLKQGADSSDSQYRLICCALFGILQHSFSIDRFKKPFNPILGETYEYVTEDYRYVSEQVSHHPPISAFNFEGNGYSGDGISYVVQKF